MKYKNYDQEDATTREDYIASRTDIIKKSFAADLWTRVITKAIDDIVYFQVQRNKHINYIPKPDELLDEQEAKDFLFNDEHLIPYDDYEVIAECSICQERTEVLMSNLASGIEMCSNCSAAYSTEDTTYEVIKVPKEITLKELVSIIYKISDIEIFRNGIRKHIEKLIRKKSNG